MTHHPTQSPQFFLTAPSPCPYVEGQFERKVFTHLVGDKAPEMNDLLTQGGFRRSQNIAYRPACEACRACISVRIIADEFQTTKNMRRVIQRNADLIGEMHDAEPSTEQYSLFRTYLDARHRKGGMSDMTVLDYAMMVEDTHVDTKVIEYRKRGPDTFITGKGTGELIAVALTDKMGDGLSMVYSYFDPRVRRPLARHLHDPRPYRARPRHGPAPCLSRLLGQRLAQDGIQGALPSAGASRPERLGTLHPRGGLATWLHADPARGSTFTRIFRLGPSRSPNVPAAGTAAAVRAGRPLEPGARSCPPIRPTTPRASPLPLSAG